MRELVIVISDLYLEPGPDHSAAAAGEDPAALRSLEHIARFGASRALTEGWRNWIARWLGLPQYADQAPASVAAAAAQLPAARALWLARPLHLVAGLTSLHVDRRSLLRLERPEADELAAGFAETFRGSGLALHPLEGGEFLLSGPADAAPSITTEPARLLLQPVAEALPAGEGGAALRRLGAELEMWLHAHPLNARRLRRGAVPISTLWVWGGGAPALTRPAASGQIADAAFGSDAYIRGLWRIAGGEAAPMPVDWAAVLGDRRAQRALAVVEVAELLHAHPSWRLADAVAEIDRRLLSSSLAALHRGELDRLVIVANDRSLSLRAADRWRLWRRRRAGLEGLA